MLNSFLTPSNRSVLMSAASLSLIALAIGLINRPLNAQTAEPNESAPAEELSQEIADAKKSMSQSLKQIRNYSNELRRLRGTDYEGSLEYRRELAISNELFDRYADELREFQGGKADLNRMVAEAAAVERRVANAFARELADAIESLQRQHRDLLAKSDDQPYGGGPLTPDSDDPQALRDNPLTRQLGAQLQLREKQLAEIAAELAKQQQDDLPPLKNAEIKIFQLVHAAPQDLAKVIDSIFSPAQLRLSIDDRTKSLVVMGDKESLAIVEALLMKMDQPADGAADHQSQQLGTADRSADRSLLLRIFWLADGLPENEGRDPSAYLPKSVLKALDGLGLQDPRLVAQTVNSLAFAGIPPVNFASSVPVVLFKAPVQLTCQGQLESLADGEARLSVSIGLPVYQIDLNGSLATPLGHYMVLGTANSVIPDQATLAASQPPLGMEMGGGYGGRAMMGRGGFGPADPAMGEIEGSAPQPTEPNYHTSRFAFVVQVIEGESFAAEE